MLLNANLLLIIYLISVSNHKINIYVYSSGFA